MFPRIATLLAALILAATPTVRAMCDVGCVTVPSASRGSAEQNQGHCGTIPAAPASDDDCGHNHGASDSMVPASKAGAPAAATTAAVPGPANVSYRASARAAVAADVPPDSPPPTRPLPLRI